MTDNEIDKLADAIVLRMMAKQEEYDKQFIEDVKVLVKDGTEINIELDSGIEKIIDKVADLEDLLATAIDDQNFLEAKKIADKIEELKNKYNL
tara:strand:- start:2686 stop:2964 length:279 start_codon:yes stop_codon:yes gene_type:complete